MESTLFPTTVIGSLPRPAWVLDLILDRKAGHVSEEEAEPLLDRAIESSIALQERAGLEEITDGEWRRESYVKVFAERVRGFQADLHDSGMRSNMPPRWPGGWIRWPSSRRRYGWDWAASTTVNPGWRVSKRW